MQQFSENERNLAEWLVPTQTLVVQNTLSTWQMEFTALILFLFNTGIPITLNVQELSFQNSFTIKLLIDVLLLIPSLCNLVGVNGDAKPTVPQTHSWEGKVRLSELEMRNICSQPHWWFYQSESQGSWSLGIFKFLFNWEDLYMTFHVLKVQKWLGLDLQQVRCDFWGFCFSMMNPVILSLLNSIMMKIIYNTNPFCYFHNNIVSRL